VSVKTESKSTPNEKALGDSSETVPPAYRAEIPEDAPGSIAKPPPAALDLENVELIIQWFTKTVHTVNSPSNPAALEICQTVILEQAMQHHFLLHGLLALSALHLAESHADTQRYIRIATAHHNQGLSLYHAILEDINEANYAASIAFSSITVMFAFALSRPHGSETAARGLVDDLAQIFLLVKAGTKSLVPQLVWSCCTPTSAVHLRPAAVCSLLTHGRRWARSTLGMQAVIGSSTRRPSTP
jgi:hypothetical protein